MKVKNIKIENTRKFLDVSNKAVIKEKDFLKEEVDAKVGTPSEEEAKALSKK